MITAIILGLLGLSVMVGAALVQNKADLARCNGEKILRDNFKKIKK